MRTLTPIILITLWGVSTIYASDPQPDKDTIRRLIGRLDADAFADRDEATRQLAELGAAAIPLLAEATNHASAEVRERALILLAMHQRFDDVAPHLMRAVAKGGGASPARSLLETRCLEQIDLAAQNPTAARLLKFWGTNHENYRAATLEAFKNVKTNSELVRVVEPLVGLPHKAATFGDLMTRLAKLSVPSDHRYAAGYIVAETLALGLREDRSEYVAFASRYVEALEKLAVELQKSNTTPNAIRDEIANRATWCQGATSYLTRMLDPASETSILVTQRFGMESSFVSDDFFRGLSSADSAVFSRGVGRVHIVDLLGESLRKWPTVPGEGAVEQLVSNVIECAKAGDKPKALIYIEALDACHELTERGLDVEQGLGKQLADRYFLTAQSAPDHRSYFAARNIHMKLRTLVECRVPPDHVAFPRQLFESLTANAGADSEKHRVTLERYVSVLDRLARIGVDFQQPGAIRFTCAVRERLTQNPNQIESLHPRLEQLTRDVARSAVDSVLSNWAAELESP